MNKFNTLFDDLIVERDTSIRKVGIFPGAFKPPHMGHFFTALQACKDNDSVYIFISKKPRALSTQNKSKPGGPGDCDADRYTNFMKNDKYTGNLLNVEPAACSRLTSASVMRAALALGNQGKETVYNNIPEMVNRDQVWDILNVSNDISNGDNFGHITINQALDIWGIYKDSLINSSDLSSDDINIVVSEVSPVKDTYDLVSDMNNSEMAGSTSVKLYVGT